MSNTETDTFEYGIGVTTLEASRGSVDSIQEDSPIAINGVAIPENAVLRGGQGVEHFYPPEMAQEAASVLQEQIDDPDATVHLVKNFHELDGQAPADDIIGEVTAAGYEQGVGVRFGAETTDEETAQKINNGYLDVSPTVARGLGELDEQMQARRVTEVAGFRDVAVVGRGQDGTDVAVGPNPAVEALARAVFDDADGETDPDELETMSLNEAKATLADEYGVDVADVEAQLDQLADDDGGSGTDDERTVRLVESE